MCVVFNVSNKSLIANVENQHYTLFANQFLTSLTKLFKGGRTSSTGLVLPGSLSRGTCNSFSG